MFSVSIIQNLIGIALRYSTNSSIQHLENEFIMTNVLVEQLLRKNEKKMIKTKISLFMYLIIVFWALLLLYI